MLVQTAKNKNKKKDPGGFLTLGWVQSSPVGSGRVSLVALFAHPTGAVVLAAPLLKAGWLQARALVTPRTGTCPVYVCTRLPLPPPVREFAPASTTDGPSARAQRRATEPLDEVEEGAETKEGGEGAESEGRNGEGAEGDEEGEGEEDGEKEEASTNDIQWDPSNAGNGSWS